MAATLAGLTSTATRAACGTSTRRSFQPLSRQLGSENIDSRDVAARSREVCDEAKPCRVVPDEKDNGKRRCYSLGRECRRRTSGGDHGNAAANQFGRQRW